MPQHAPKWNVNVFLHTKCPITQLTPLVTFIRTTQIIPTQTFHYFEHWKKGIIINTFSLLIGTSIIWKSQIDPLFYRTFVIKINPPGPLPFIFQHKPFRLPFIIDFPHHYSNIPIQFKDKFKKKRKKNTNPFSVFSSWNTKLHRKLTINLVFKYISIHTHTHANAFLLCSIEHDLDTTCGCRFESSEMLANHVASSPLLSESWRLCCDITTAASPSIPGQSFVMKQVGSIGYVAFSSIISEAEAGICCCNGNLVALDDQFFSPLNKQINEGEEEPVLVHAGFLRLFFSIYASPIFQTQVITTSLSNFLFYY